MIKNSVLHWLEVILNERFGQDFLLSHQSETDHLVMSLHGSAQQIIFPNLQYAFYQADQRIDCTHYDVDSDFIAPIDSKLPAPGYKKLPQPLIESTSDTYFVHYDILGLTYWMLSRQEEVGRNDLDSHGRFPATSSHAHQHNYLHRPIVDEWLEILRQIILKAWPGMPLKTHQFEVKLSHDVDRPSRFGFTHPTGLLKKMGGSLVKYKDIKSAILAPYIWLNTKKALHPSDPYNTFDWIMDVSESLGLRSAFYFICGGNNPKYDPDYDLEHPAILDLITKIHNRGHEIGLHPSYDTYQSLPSIVNEAQKLREICQRLHIKQDVFGGRMHYLRWEPDTLLAWEKAQMKYDSTLSYADQAGFRCGTCFEYPAIHPVLKQQLKLRIRPLIAMEASILYYEDSHMQDKQDKFELLRNNCQKVNGCFTLLWHNSEFNASSQKELYSNLLVSIK